MKKENYQASITAYKPVSACIADISHVEDWWTRNFEGHADKLNASFKVTFSETFVIFRVAEFDPGKKIVWLVTDCNLPMVKDKKEWKGTQVVWELSSVSGGTEVTMTHVGLVPEVECFEICQTGWNFYVKTSLFKLLTEGKGLPDKRAEYVKESIS